MLKHLAQEIVKFLKSEDGPTSTEYAINLALIATVLVSSVSTIGAKAKAQFNTVANAVGSTTGS